MFRVDIFRGNFDVTCVISMGLVSNAVVMFHVLDAMFHQVCLHLGAGKTWGFPGISRTSQC